MRRILTSATTKTTRQNRAICLYLAVGAILVFVYQQLSYHLSLPVSDSHARRVNTHKVVLQINRDQHDFGMVSPGSSHSLEFDIKNAGDADLVVHTVETTCGCSTATLDSKTIKPGSCGKLRVSVTFPAFDGEVAEAVFLKSNASDTPRVAIRIMAHCQWPVRVEPTDVVFDHINRDQEYVTRLEVSSPQKLPFQISEIRPSTPTVKTFLSPYDKNQNSCYYLNVNIKPTTQGAFNETITLVTTSPRRQIIIPVRAWVR